MNSVNIIGNLVKDPELRRTSQGTPVTTFTIAINRIGTTDNQADFIDCVAWNKLAELIDQYCLKGNKLGIKGKLQTRIYENRDGKKVKITEVVCENVEFLTPKNQQTPNNQNNFSNTENDPFNSNAFNIMDDDLPF